MNLQQLEYIVAVDRLQHFARAAEACHVTQPTLSAMVMKLEDELDVKIFDRTAQPVVTTDVGRDIVDQAVTILRQVKTLKETALESATSIKGTFVLGIIPTVSPYLLPGFLFGFLSEYPDLKLTIKEIQTQELLKKLRSGEIDAGIAATPVADFEIIQRRLYLEPLKLYVSEKEEFAGDQYILPNQLDPNKLWLLEEGNCLRDQFINLCGLKENQHKPANLNFDAGNFETLLNLVSQGGGMTLIPQLAVKALPEDKQKQVREFAPPLPVREISLLYYRQYARERINKAVAGYIQQMAIGWFAGQMDESNCQIISIQS
jgi:LysR family hydrogen peroxide-inducible transcriptional activator